MKSGCGSRLVSSPSYFPIGAAPLYGVLKDNIRKAEKASYVTKGKSDRTILQNIRHYFIEFDGKQHSLTTLLARITNLNNGLCLCLHCLVSLVLFRFQYSISSAATP